MDVVPHPAPKRSAPSSNPTSDTRCAQFKAQLDRFKVFSVEQQCHWNFGETTKHPLKTSLYYKLEPLTSEELDTYTPYNMSWHHAALFPEWYFHLLRNFANRSEYHKHYCLTPRRDFGNLLIGSDQEKTALLTALDTDFSHAFNVRLGDLFSTMFHDRVLTREVVETEIVKIFADMASPPAYLIRNDRLAEKVSVGNIQPQVDFLMAFDYSEKDIWMTICGLLLKNIVNSELLLTFEEISETFISAKKYSVSDVYDFVQLVDSKGLIPSKAGAIPKPRASSYVPKRPHYPYAMRPSKREKRMMRAER
ncbi:hypothetical protein JCM33374_g3284 [Metschnikowia sp. JCM 33374]|nr:hypothetical protein JCM33374_g3284 [Metschnikowia sp. JCM 33374]